MSREERWRGEGGGGGGAQQRGNRARVSCVQQLVSLPKGRAFTDSTDVKPAVFPWRPTGPAPSSSLSILSDSAVSGAHPHPAKRRPSSPQTHRTSRFLRHNKSRISVLRCRDVALPLPIRRATNIIISACCCVVAMTTLT